MAENYNTEDLKFEISFNFEQLKQQLDEIKSIVATLSNNLKNQKSTVNIDTKQAENNIKNINTELKSLDNAEKTVINETKSLSNSVNTLSSNLKTAGAGIASGLGGAFDKIKTKFEDFKNKFTVGNLSSGLEKVKNSALIAVPGVETLVDTFSKFTSVQGWVELGAQALTKFYSVVMEGLGTLNDLESAMAGIGDSFSDQERAQYLPQFSAEIRQLAVDTGTSIPKLAEGLDTIADSGIDLSNAMDILKISRQAASATGADISQASEAITNIMNNMNVSSQEAADALFTFKDTARLSFNELDTEMRKIMPLASQLGIGIQELGGVLESLGQKGLKGKQGVAGLEALLNSFADENIADKFRHLGIDVVDAFGKVNDLGSIMTQSLQKGLSDQDLRDILPSNQAVKVFDILIEESKNAGGEIVSALESSMSNFSPDEMAGALNHAGELVGETTNKLQAKLTAQWEETKAQIAEPFEGLQDTWIKIETAIAKIIPYITEFYSWVYKIGSYLVGWPFYAIDFVSELITGEEEIENITKEASLFSNSLENAKIQAQGIADLSKQSGIPVETLNMLKSQKELYKQIEDSSAQTANNERQRLERTIEINKLLVSGLITRKRELTQSAIEFGLKNYTGRDYAAEAERLMGLFNANPVITAMDNAIAAAGTARGEAKAALDRMPAIETSDEREKRLRDQEKARQDRIRASANLAETQLNILKEVYGMEQEINVEIISNDDERISALQEEERSYQAILSDLTTMGSEYKGTGTIRDLIDEMSDKGMDITDIIAKSQSYSGTEIEKVLKYLADQYEIIHNRRMTQLKAEQDEQTRSNNVLIERASLEKSIAEASTPELRRKYEIELETLDQRESNLKAIFDLNQQLLKTNLTEEQRNAIIAARTVLLESQIGSQSRDFLENLQQELTVSTLLTEADKQRAELRSQGIFTEEEITKIIKDRQQIKYNEITRDYANEIASAQAINEYERKRLEYQQQGYSITEADNLINQQKIIDKAKESFEIKQQLDMSLLQTEEERKKQEMRNQGLYTEEEINKIYDDRIKIQYNNIVNNNEREYALAQAINEYERKRLEYQQQGFSLDESTNLVSQEQLINYTKESAELQKQLSLSQITNELDRKKLEYQQSGLYTETAIIELMKTEGQILTNNILKSLNEQLELAGAANEYERKMIEYKRQGLNETQALELINKQRQIDIKKENTELQNQLNLSKASAGIERIKLELKQKGLYTTEAELTAAANIISQTNTNNQLRTIKDQIALEDAKLISNEEYRRVQLEQQGITNITDQNELITKQNELITKQNNSYQGVYNTQNRELEKEKALLDEHSDIGDKKIEQAAELKDYQEMLNQQLLEGKITQEKINDLIEDKKALQVDELKLLQDQINLQKEGSLRLSELELAVAQATTEESRDQAQIELENEQRRIKNLQELDAYRKQLESLGFKDQELETMVENRRQTQEAQPVSDLALYQEDLEYRLKISNLEDNITLARNESNEELAKSYETQKETLEIEHELENTIKEKLIKLGLEPGTELYQQMYEKERLILEKAKENNSEQINTNNSLQDRIDKMKEQLSLISSENDINENITDEKQRQIELERTKGNIALEGIGAEATRLIDIQRIAEAQGTFNDEQRKALKDLVGLKEDDTVLSEDQLKQLQDAIDKYNEIYGMQVQINEENINEIEQKKDVDIWEQFTTFDTDKMMEGLPDQFTSIGMGLASNLGSAFAGEMDAQDLGEALGKSALQAGSQMLATINPFLGMAASMLTSLFTGIFDQETAEEKAIRYATEALEEQKRVIEGINDVLDAQMDYFDLIKEAWSFSDDRVKDYLETVIETNAQLLDNADVALRLDNYFSNFKLDLKGGVDALIDMDTYLSSDMEYLEKYNEASKKAITGLAGATAIEDMKEYIGYVKELVSDDVTLNDSKGSLNILQERSNALVSEYNNMLESGVDANSDIARALKLQIDYMSKISNYLQQNINRQEILQNMSSEQLMTEMMSEAELLYIEKQKLRMIEDQESAEYKRQLRAVEDQQSIYDGLDRMYQLRKEEEEDALQRVKDLKEANEQAFSDEMDMLELQHGANRTSNEDYLNLLTQQDEKIQLVNNRLEEQKKIWDAINDTLNEMIGGITDEASAEMAKNAIKMAAQDTIKQMEAMNEKAIGMAVVSANVIGKIMGKTQEQIDADVKIATDILKNSLLNDPEYLSLKKQIAEYDELEITAGYKGMTEQFEDMERMTELEKKQLEYDKQHNISLDEQTEAENKIKNDRQLQINYIDKILSKADEYKLTEEDIHSWEMKRLDLLSEQTTEIEKQNDELDTMDSKLRELYKQRQNIELMAVKEGWTAERLAQYQGVTTNIATRMGELGYDQAVINSTLGQANKIPQYDEGGYIPNDVIAQLHAGEFVLTKNILDGLRNNNGYAGSMMGNSNSNNSSISNGVQLSNNIYITGITDTNLIAKIKTTLENESPEILRKALNKNGMNINSIR